MSPSRSGALVIPPLSLRTASLSFDRLVIGTLCRPITFAECSGNFKSHATNVLTAL